MWFQPGSVKLILFCKYSRIPLSSKLKSLIYCFPPQPLIRIHMERMTTKPLSLSDQRRSAATLKTRSSGSKLAAYRYHTESVYNTVCTKKSGTIRKQIILDINIFQMVCVFGTMSKRNNCSFCCYLNHIIWFCKSRVRDDEILVCATFVLIVEIVKVSNNDSIATEKVNDENNNEKNYQKHLLA